MNPSTPEVPPPSSSEKNVGEGERDTAATTSTLNTPPVADETVLTRQRRRKLFLFGAALLVVYAIPLWGLVRLALGEELHSHILLIPLISGYLIYLHRRQLPWNAPSSPGLAALTATLALAIGGLGVALGEHLERVDHLTVMILSWMIMVQALGFAVLGLRWMKAALFPMLFLIFTVPIPHGLEDFLETSLKFASADASALFFEIVGLPFLREGPVFQLPGIVIEVAQECSGIRSSYILVITSLLAGYLFLNSPWRRTVLALAVIPLGILRNGFRIVTIGWLCVHYGPHMIDSPIHHHGGPFFFALSLIPLFALLWWLVRRERRGMRNAECGMRSRTE